MRLIALSPALLAAGTLAAQNPPRAMRIEPGPFRVSWNGQPQAVIGITTSGAASSRDTLGVLVNSVRTGSPADKAGIEEGNRIASINGVSLKLNAADVGDDDMAGVMTRRLTREIDKLKPGDEVDLHVYANGQTKSVKVKTVSSDSLYESMTRRYFDDRATLGLSLASTGSRRDTIGVFVIGVEESGPAAKAGIEEGSRIASINNVDVRGRAGDEDETFFRTTNVSRFEREVSKVKPGDEVTLKVYYNGQYKNVTVKAVRAADLPPHKGSVTIIGGDNMVMPQVTRIPGGRIEINGQDVGARVRDALDNARIATNAAVGGALTGFGRGFMFGNRVSW
jgi:C-terminal processing protease CtpA/Prc